MTKLEDGMSKEEKRSFTYEKVRIEALIIESELSNVIKEDLVSNKIKEALEGDARPLLIKRGVADDRSALSWKFLAIGYYDKKWRFGFYNTRPYQLFKAKYILPLRAYELEAYTLPIHQIHDLEDLKSVLEELKLTDIREDGYIEERLREGK